MKKHLPTIIVVIIFLCGLALFLYPTISNLYNEHLNKQYIAQTEEYVSDFKNEEYEKIKKDARLYNENIYNPDRLKELGLTYENVLNIYGDGAMGYIEIPKISVSLMIYHTVEEDKLQDGLGHMEETSLPIGGENTHSVLAGHTGLPSAKLLTNLDRMEVGDRFYIHVLDEVLEYQVDNIVVVEPEEAEHISVISGQDLVTIVTCTPYGINSHRLLVRGVRCEEGGSLTGDGGLEVGNEASTVQMRYMITYSLIGLVLIGVAINRFMAILKRKRKGGAAREQEK